MLSQQEIEQEINNIKQRNKKVEADKAWEISLFRRLFITLVTYITAGIWLVLINDTNPWFKALVPAIAYIFSTLSLPMVKKWWIKQKFK